MLKKSLKTFTLEAHKAHEHAKADLLKAINNNALTGTFGQANIDNALRAESLVSQLVFTPEYLDSEEFANTSEEELRSWLVDFHRGLKNRENNMQLKGFDPKQAWTLSGTSQLRVFLDGLLNQS